MTTESNDNDPRVSRTYRSLATETTPEELDHKILAMAAGGTSRSRYGLIRAWIRPAAWAATIGLSLAFVLEMSQFRDATAPHPDADSVEVLDKALIHEKAPARAKASKLSQQEVGEPAQAPVPAPQADVGLTTDRASVTADVESDQMNLVQEAEEQVRPREDSAPAPASAMEVRSFSAAMPLEKKEQAEHCDEDARSSAASWYACIEALRHKGFADAADRELESLQREFPDFQGSGENK